ncbi:hypothetical protein BTO06_01465 [Tenacibaculum sp. SZ-18]|nr:hypothetical protein BTO06_01465 [Tenacibaculum sp. SZ-18]
MDVYAQEPIAIHISDKDGFPDNEVYDLLQDKKGNIWIAANKGLFKFDGKTFTQLTHPKKQGRSFFNLTLDPKGRVWCNNLAGQFFYVEDNKLQLFGNYQNIIKGAYTDFVFLKDKLAFKIYTKPIPTTFVIDLKTKEKKTIPINVRGTTMGLVFDDKLLYISEKFKIKSYNLSTTSDSLISSKINDNRITFSNLYRLKNKLWIIRSDEQHLNTQVYKFEKDLQKLAIPQEINTHRVEGLFESDCNYYFSTSNGLYICNEENNSLEIKDHYLKGVFVTKSLIDVNNNLWIATLDNSIYIIPNEQLKRLSEISDVSVLEKKNDTLCYIGTSSGSLLEYNKLSNSIQKNTFSDGFYIRSLSYNRKAKRLLYASDNSLFTLDNYRKKENIEIENTSGIKNTSVINDSTYIISAANGVYVTQGINYKNRITFKRAYTCLSAKFSDMIYVSDVDGLHAYSKDLSNKKEIKIDDNSIYTFKMAESANGIVWVSTYDNGVYGIKNDVVVKKINEDNGLASNYVNTISAYGNDLWIATEKGVQRYDIKNGIFKILTKQDGINSYAIKHLEVLENDVIFSSNIGLYSFNKHSIFKERELQKPYVRSVKIREKDTLVQSNYILPQEFSNIQFNFNIKGFHSNQSIIYQYFLEGLDSDWKTLTRGSDYLNYNSLPEGNFKLRYRIIDESKNISREGDSINIQITLPIYKTEWFRIVSFTFIILLVILYYKRITKRLEAAQRIKLEKAEMNRDLIFSQLENLRSQMNPHFIFNALNSIQDYIIINEKKLAREYLVRFARLIRLYLDQSRKKEILLEDELSTLKLYLELEQERFENGFDYEVNVDDNLELSSIYIPSLFIQPYVENALKHGLLHKTEDKKLEVSFTKDYETKSLKCIILDNGIGRKAASKIKEKRQKGHVSFATSANQKRVKLLNTAMSKNIQVKILDLYDKDGNSIGTKVIIKLPL